MDLHEDGFSLSAGRDDLGKQQTGCYQQLHVHY